jgi:hypothetical protein
MKRRTVLVLALASTLCACGGGDEDFEPVELPQQRIRAPWAYTSLRETYVVRNDAQWQSTWNLHLPRSEAYVRPQIDFSRFMVVGITRGSAPDTCHSVSITRATETRDDIRVEFEQTGPRPGYGCGQAVVPLTDFVIVPVSDKPVNFVEKTV